MPDTKRARERVEAAVVKTPTLDAMRAVKAESQAIGNFLSWLEERNWFIASYPTPEFRINQRAFPVNENIEQLLARYFGIDLDEAENEKRAIIARLTRPKRAAPGKGGGR